MKFRIELTRRANKSLTKLHPKDRVRVESRITELETNPLMKSQSLSGQLYGLRKTKDKNIRILFILDLDAQVLVVESIEYRGNAY
jgi:mRNA-degrading endonuclease RelE of RelBE toxin-antitoxin system